MLFSRTLLLALMFASPAVAMDMGRHDTEAMGPADCSHMEAWNFATGMCQAIAKPGMPMSMTMFHYNAFLVQSVLEKPRGEDALAAPNMFMADIGTSVGERNYINVDLMATLERWTLPANGYPEHLQIGEEKSDGTPYLDAQHPHSSPLMGASFSDTYTLGADRDYVRLSFAPRGQSTDGPVAFMHRVTGMVNPDAPLGHHIGQDVGHITSTVLAAEWRLGRTTLEASTFNGTEPEPSHVDLPLGTMNSYAARVTGQFTDHFYAMASAAYVKSPESHDVDLDHVWRYSASAYYDAELADGWRIDETLIWGLINFYDEAAALNSFNEEFVFRKAANRIWGRAEVLQRTPAELAIVDSNPSRAVWVSALTLGYTRVLASFSGQDLGLGGSLGQDYLPGDFRAAYGGDPLTARLFLQLGGMF